MLYPLVVPLQGQNSNMGPSIVRWNVAVTCIKDSDLAPKLREGFSDVIKGR